MSLEFDIDQIIKWSQLLLNFFALGIGAWIYKSYIENLKSSISSKDEQVKVLESHLNLWKDKAELLEKRSPEFMENILSQRIRTREDEIKRLSEDKETHKKEIEIQKQELSDLQTKLEETKKLKTKLNFIDEDNDIKNKVVHYLTNYMFNNKINFEQFIARECISDFLKEFNMDSGLNLSKLEIRQYISEIKHERR